MGSQERRLRINGSDYFFDLYIPENNRHPWAAIFLHGAFCSKSQYTDLGAAISNKGMVAAIPDMPGHGKTTSEFSMPEAVESTQELRNFLRACYNAEKVGVGGYSVGARVAFEVGAKTRSADALAIASMPRKPIDYVGNYSIAKLQARNEIRSDNGIVRARQLHTRNIKETYKRFAEIEDAIGLVDAVEAPVLFMYGFDFHVRQSDNYIVFTEMEKRSKTVTRAYVGSMSGQLIPEELKRLGKKTASYFAKTFEEPSKVRTAVRNVWRLAVGNPGAAR